jgi:hypothetical protein
VASDRKQRNPEDRLVTDSFQQPSSSTPTALKFGGMQNETVEFR